MLAVMLCLQSRCITNVAHSVRSKAGHAAIESRLETDQADRDHSVAIEPAFVVGLDARVRPDLFLIQCQPGGNSNFNLRIKSVSAPRDMKPWWLIGIVTKFTSRGAPEPHGPIKSRVKFRPGSGRVPGG